MTSCNRYVHVRAPRNHLASEIGQTFIELPMHVYVHMPHNSLQKMPNTVKAVVDFHVMPAGLGAYPIILGRPWLRG